MVDEGDGGARLTGAARTPDAVLVVVDVLGHVVVDDQVHVRQVQAARGHVGRDHHARAALDELVDDAHAGYLRFVRVQDSGRYFVGT